VGRGEMSAMGKKVKMKNNRKEVLNLQKNVFLTYEMEHP
jgi:hypothetical protein